MSFMLPDKKKNNIRSAKKSLVERKSKRLLAEENPYYIIVDKSEYELKVYSDDGRYATYPIKFDR